MFGPFGARAFRLALGLLAALTLATPSLAQALIDPKDPQSLAEVLIRNGFQAKMDKEKSGRPLIRSSSEGISFVVFFYGCKENIDCRSINFATSFTLKDPISNEKINEWNLGRTVGKAYIAENGSARLSHFVAMRGGVSEDAFMASFDLWRYAALEYARHVGYRK